METAKMILHAERLNKVLEMIILEEDRVYRMREFIRKYNWVFFTLEQRTDKKLTMSHKLEIQLLTLDRLKEYYINNSQIR